MSSGKCLLRAVFLTGKAAFDTGRWAFTKRQHLSFKVCP